MTMKIKAKSSKTNPRQKIIHVATRLMSQKGYKATTIDEITSKVPIHKSTFFHYFKNKEELLMEVLRIGLSDVTEKLKLILEDENLSPKEKLKAAITIHLERLVEFKDNVAVYHSEIRFLSRKNKVKYLEQRNQYACSFEKIINSIKQSDPECFRGLDTKMVTFGVLGMCNWVVKWFKKSGAYGPRDIADIFYQTIIKESDNK